MTVDKAEVKAFLAHYASEFYDPAKAHEYYVKNRELKGGRQPVKGETKDQRKARVATNGNQREARMYVDKQISAKKKADSKGLQTSQQARMVKLRQNAEASQKRIEEKLNKFLVSLKAQQTPLNEIPANASPKLRAYLEKQNANISKSNALAKNKAATEAKTAARAEMKRVGTELKTAVATARDSYAKAKAGLDAKYKTASDTEHKNIAANVK